MDATADTRQILDSHSSDGSEYRNNNDDEDDTNNVNTIGTPAYISGRFVDDDGIDNETENLMTTTNDELEDDEEVLIKRPTIAPHDRYSFTYMAFYLLGMTTLLPWNFFLTAEPVSIVPVALVSFESNLMYIAHAAVERETECSMFI